LSQQKTTIAHDDSTFRHTFVAKSNLKRMYRVCDSLAGVYTTRGKL